MTQSTLAAAPGPMGARTGAAEGSVLLGNFRVMSTLVENSEKLREKNLLADAHHEILGLVFTSKARPMFTTKLEKA